MLYWDMRFLIALLSIILISAPVAATEREADIAAARAALSTPGPQNGMRGFIWGVGPEDVAEFEKAVSYEKAGGVVYYLEMYKGFRRLIGYEFDENGLWRMRAEFVNLHYPVSQTVIQLTLDEETILTELFGPPSKKQFLWERNTYRGHPERWGRAVASGDLKIITEWQTEDTVVRQETFHEEGFYQVRQTYTRQDRYAAPQTYDILGRPQ